MNIVLRNDEQTYPKTKTSTLCLLLTLVIKQMKLVYHKLTSYVTIFNFPPQNENATLLNFYFLLAPCASECLALDKIHGPIKKKKGIWVSLSMVSFSG